MSIDTLTDFSEIFNTDLFSSPSASSPSSGSASPRTPPNVFSTPFLTTDDSDKPFDPMSMFSTQDYLSQSYSPSSSIPVTAATGATTSASAAPLVSADMDIDPSQPPIDLAALLAAFQPQPSPADQQQALELAFAMQQQQQLLQMMQNIQPMQTIDPQLVGTPASSNGINNDSDFAGDEEDHGVDESDLDEDSEPAPPTTKSKKGKGKKVEEPPQEKLTLTIQPMKVAGHGKGGRKGTVASGGVVKKSATAKAPAPTSPAPAPTIKHVIPPVTNNVQHNDLTGDEDTSPIELETTFARGLPASAYYPTRLYPNKDGDDKKDDKDDDLPQDWRPPPEVFQKMTSKEKRQLRNKISARNFRVRRKEYISTLEYDIAERDRLLDVIRTELGSTQSENFALRQEIATLKKTLLEGRSTSSLSFNESALLSDGGVTGLGLTLPPPAPLPAKSAAEVLAMQAAAGAITADALDVAPAAATAQVSSPLLTANTQKDLSSTASGSRFWGGLGTFGGVTPVHRMVVPELAVGGDIGYSLPGVLAAVKESQEMQQKEPQVHVPPARRGLQENMNPMLNKIISGLGGSTATPTASTKPLGESNKANMRDSVPKSWFAPSMFAPAPSASTSSPPASSPSPPALGGFDGYADLNPFTMKTMDAYRMHLWGKMAQQQAFAQQQANHVPQYPNSANTSPGSSPGGSPQMSPFTYGYGQQQGYAGQQGLAGGLRPAFFSAPTNSLSSLLSGKHAASGAGLPPYSPPPPPYSGASSPVSSPLLIAKAGTFDRAERERAAERARDSERERQKEKERMEQRQKEREVQLAAQIASQTLFKKLGGAFWDAFAGSSSSSSSSSSVTSSSSSPSVVGASTNPTGFQGQRSWDADKVRKVLEGKAVVRVVDIEDLPKMQASSSSLAAQKHQASECDRMKKSCTDLLEEGMRGLSLATKKP